MKKYVEIDKVLTDENIHTMPFNCGKAAGQVFVFVEDIEKNAEDAMSKSDVLKMLNEIEESLGLSHSFQFFMARNVINKYKKELNPEENI